MSLIDHSSSNSVAGIIATNYSSEEESFSTTSSSDEDDIKYIIRSLGYFDENPVFVFNDGGWISRKEHKTLYRRCRRYLIHDIWVRRQSEPVINFINRIYNTFHRLRPGHVIFGIVWAHNDANGLHFHTVHDCPYSNRSCRCAGFGEHETVLRKRRVHFKRRIFPTATFIDPAYVANLATYSGLRGRYRMFITIGGHSWQKGEDQAEVEKSSKWRLMKDVRITPRMFDVQKFIHEVEKRPQIWHHRDKSAAAMAIRRRAWEELARVMFTQWKVFPQEVKEEKRKDMRRMWRSLERHYTDELSRKLAHGVADEVILTKLAFLKKIPLQSDKRIAAVGREGRTRHLSSPTTKVHSPTQGRPPGRRKLSGEDSEDDDRSFFNSLLPVVKRLNDKQKIDFRLEVLNSMKRVQSGKTLTSLLAITSSSTTPVAPSGRTQRANRMGRRVSRLNR